MHFNLAFTALFCKMVIYRLVAVVLRIRAFRIAVFCPDGDIRYKAQQFRKPSFESRDIPVCIDTAQCIGYGNHIFNKPVLAELNLLDRIYDFFHIYRLVTDMLQSRNYIR